MLGFTSLRFVNPAQQVCFSDGPPTTPTAQEEHASDLPVTFLPSNTSNTSGKQPAATVAQNHSKTCTESCINRSPEFTLASGKKMPPARAATEGMAGDSTASPSTREYVSPRVVLPKAATME